MASSPRIPQQASGDPVRKAVTLIGMDMTVARRFETQIGLLESYEVTLGTPDTYTTDGAPHVAVLVYRSCSAFVVEQLRRDIAPDAAIEAWLDQANAVLRLLRAHRADLFALEFDLCLNDPTTVRNALSDTHNLFFSNEAPGPNPAETDIVLMYLAQEAFHKSAKARRVQAELDASARLAGEPAPGKPDLNTVYKDILSQTRGPGGMLSDDRLEYALLEEQLAQAQAQINELETTALRQSAQFKTEREELCAELEMMKVEQAATDAAMQALRAQVKEKEAALASKRRWLEGKLRKAVTQADDAIRRSKKERARLQEEIDRRDAELDTIYRSKSWRVTGPLRRVRRLLSGGKE